MQAVLNQQFAAQSSGNVEQAKTLEKQLVDLKRSQADLVDQLRKVDLKRAEIARFDQQIKDVLTEYQKSAAAENPNEEQQKKQAVLKDQLRTILNSQFQERQKTESGELQRLRDRLEELEKEINERTQNREDVIKRRLEQLLSAKTAAEANPPAPQGTPILDGFPSTSATGTTSLRGKSDFVPNQPSELPIDGKGTITPAPAVPNPFSDNDERPQPKK